nr:MAG: hypothetical protein [Bacteriophage sp.]
MTSEIDKLKHFHAENYSDTNFTDDLNDGEEFLYTTIGIKDDKEVTFLCKYVKNKHIEVCPWKKYIEASYKYRTNTDKMTASDYTHLFGYLNPYYRSAYNVPKRRK